MPADRTKPRGMDALWSPEQYRPDESNAMNLWEAQRLYRDIKRAQRIRGGVALLAFILS